MFNGFLRHCADMIGRLFHRKQTGRRSPHSAVVGTWGENQAARFLERAGYTLLGRNLRPNKHDELDIIARKGEWLVIVEVKTRKTDYYVRPIRSIDARKRKALNRGAVAYLRKAHYPTLYYRFDVIEVVGQPEWQNPPKIRHIEDAFPFDGRHYFPTDPPAKHRRS